jgi:hypothetical protein
MISFPATVDALDLTVVSSDWRHAKIDVGLPLGVDTARIAIDAFDRSVVEPDHHGSAIGVGKPDQGIREIPGSDAGGLPLKPLILSERERPSTDLPRWLA